MAAKDGLEEVESGISLGVGFEDSTQQREQREAADGRRGIAAQVEMQEAVEWRG